MLEIRRCLDLGQETLGPDHCGELRTQDLHGDAAIMFDILRQVHCRHSARTQLAHYPVAVSESGSKTNHWLRHCR